MIPVRNRTATLSAFLVVGLLLSLSGSAVAHHHRARDQTDNQIVLGPICAGPVSYDADRTFFVSHGWYSPGWSELNGSAKRSLMHPATTFRLYIDNELQKSSMWSGYDRSTDVKSKIYTTEVHGGLPAGHHDFRGEWWTSDGEGDFRDSILVITCDVPVDMA